MSKNKNAVGVFVLSLSLFLLWRFPDYWYASEWDDSIWFGEQEDVEDWEYEGLSVDKAAESILAADDTTHGQFLRSEEGDLVSVFSAKRFVEKWDEGSLFSHTPDRCWTGIGMKILPEAPFFIERELHGIPLVLERRIFAIGRDRELVYFGAIVGGKSYRLNQFLDSEMNRENPGERLGVFRGFMERLSNSRMWSKSIESFLSRERFIGPQHMFRVSTSVQDDLDSAEDRLEEILEKWLVPTSYQDERSVFLLQNDE